jgi:hypothetical protein
MSNIAFTVSVPVVTAAKFAALANSVWFSCAFSAMERRFFLI